MRTLRRTQSAGEIECDWWPCREQQCAGILGRLDIAEEDLFEEYSEKPERLCSLCGTFTDGHWQLFHLRVLFGR